MRSHRPVSILPALTLGLFFLASGLSAQSLFIKPVKVFGDPNFIGTAANPLAFDSYGPNVVEGRELDQPLGIALDSSKSSTSPNIYISDSANNRVLAYKYSTQLTAGSFADLVLGQPSQLSNLVEGPGSVYTTGMNSPTGIAVDSAGNLYVADSGNNRILRYPQPFAQPAGYQFPNMIIGQASFASSGANTGGIKASTLALAGGRTGLAFDAAGNLWVTDTGNNRVLRFPVAALTAGTNAPSADTAVGQADLVSALSATGVNGASPQMTKTGLRQPEALAFDSSGNMFVADTLQRVLVYSPGAITGTAASRILGVAVQGQETTPAAVGAVVFSNVLGVAVAGPNILVSDTGNNRILVFGPVGSWPAESTQFSPSAVQVIGQTAFANITANQGGPPSASTLATPVDLVNSASELFVADSGNNRILVFPSGVTGPSLSGSRVIGQLGFAYRAPNLVVGKEFGFAGAVNSASGSAILDYSSTPPHLYVADTLNNRILGFKNFVTMTNGQLPDIVIGQPDVFNTLVNYPSNLQTMPSQQSLDGPTSLVVDSVGNLYVADTFNSRILRFPTPFNPPGGSTTLESADLVLGQESFTSSVTDPTATTMSAPISLAFTKDGANASVQNSGWLVAADANQNRVLMFPKPFSSGMAANIVLGQSGFATTTPDTVLSDSGLTSPRGVAVDPQDHVLVADSGNARVQVFDEAANLTNDASASFSLTMGLSQPVAIAMSADGSFWVADTGSSANHLLHFPPIQQLPTEGYASDATLPAISPRSGFVDQYANLLVADGVNRILYFAPQIGVVNAANYIVGRPLAPGTFAALFPSVSTNVIANGTQNNSGTFPLATTLADTQVLVNGTAAPLFYVSPGQINVPLSLSLPTTGTVDLQAVRQSTGQIYGGAEVPLASASPGLFSADATGNGEIVALNQDNTPNSPSNPIPRGQVLQIYATGQGPVSNPPADGTASTGQVPTAATPEVILGTTFVPSSNVQYSGLAPNLIGVWMINVQIPMTATTGTAVPIQVFMNSIPSNNPAAPTQVATTVSIK